jgi:leader peptidase (prepilin peptidase)/N-methyltransferase
VLFFSRTGWSGEFIKLSALTLILIPVAFIDLEHKLILNVFTFPGIVLGTVLQLWLNPSEWSTPLLGIVAGGGFIYLVRLFGNLALRQESMGLGDLKLAAMIGAFIGPKVVLVLFLAFFLAAPVAAMVMASHRSTARKEIPFGPFIVAATIVFILVGDQLVRIYLQVLSF